MVEVLGRMMNLGDVPIVGEADKTLQDRLKHKLEDWAIWMERSRPSLGCRSTGLKSFGLHDYDYEGLLGRAHEQAMKAVDTAINDLPPSQCAAIHRRYLGIDWRFPRDNYEQMLEGAHQALLFSLPRRNVIL